MKIGDEIRFAPSAFMNADAGSVCRKYEPMYPIKVTGTICGIHRGHRWYRVRFKVHGIVMYECFKVMPEGDE